MYPDVLCAMINRLFCFYLLIGLQALGLGCTGNESQAPVSDEPKNSPLSFTDITERAGFGGFEHITGETGEKYFPEAMGAGVALIDYNGDLWQDVLLVNGGVWPGNEPQNQSGLSLYRNNGDLTFSDVTAEAGLSGIAAYGFGVAAGDYDNDGDEDIYFTTLGPNRLFENQNNTFVDVTEASGTALDPSWSTTAIFFDADRDGWLDLYVGNYVYWSTEEDIFCTLDGTTKSYCTPELYKGRPSRFLYNNGDGTFRDRTEELGFLPSPGKMLGALEFDYNQDGMPDLVVASDTQPDLLYKNRGDGSFEEIGALSGLAYDENGVARAGMGIDAGVVDTTGRQSVFVGNFSKEMISVFRYASNDLFIDRAAASKIGRSSLMTLTFGLFLADIDLDGDLDLFTANGHVQQEVGQTQDGITYRQAPHLFMNGGNGQFTDLAPEIGGIFQGAYVGRGAVFGDLDRDGDLEIIFTENGGGVHVWRNDLDNGNAWLRIYVKGVTSNRSGLGAVIRAYWDDQEAERVIRSGASFLSQHELVATFGLGEADSIERIEIQWPGGSLTTLRDVPVNQEIRVTEGQEDYEKLER